MKFVVETAVAAVASFEDPTGTKNDTLDRYRGPNENFVLVRTESSSKL